MKVNDGDLMINVNCEETPATSSKLLADFDSAVKFQVDKSQNSNDALDH